MPTAGRATRARYVVIAFMVTLAMVTYLDRACIGAMAPKIAEEFSLDEGQMSWVFFAFILSYAIFEIPTARWADARGAKSVPGMAELPTRNPTGPPSELDIELAERGVEEASA